MTSFPYCGAIAAKESDPEPEVKGYHFTPCCKQREANLLLAETVGMLGGKRLFLLCIRRVKQIVLSDQVFAVFICKRCGFYVVKCSNGGQRKQAKVIDHNAKKNVPQNKQQQVIFQPGGRCLFPVSNRKSTMTLTL